MKQANGKGYEAAVMTGGAGGLPREGREYPGCSESAARAEDLAAALRRLGLDIDLLAHDVSTSISKVHVRPGRVKTMLNKFVVMVAAGIFSIGVLGSDAKAFDEPIPTKISLLKWGGNPPIGKLYKIVSKPAASFPLPAVGTGPDISGGSLLVNAGSGILSCNLAMAGVNSTTCKSADKAAAKNCCSVPLMFSRPSW